MLPYDSPEVLSTGIDARPLARNELFKSPRGTTYIYIFYGRMYASSELRSKNNKILYIMFSSRVQFSGNTQCCGPTEYSVFPTKHGF